MTAPTAATGELVRATKWKDYVGQETLKRRLITHIRAARAEKRQLDHLLLVAPPGSGKTTLAQLIAQELGDDFAEMMMPCDWKRFCWFLGEWKGGVMLLDEIHRAPKAFQESLLSIEQGYVLSPRGRRISTRHVTFICATTEPDKIVKPLWDRLLLKPRWEDYSDEEMALILTGMAKRAQVTLPKPVALGLAPATGGTPRVAAGLIVAARDLAVTGEPVTVESVLDLAGVDIDGLTAEHTAYLSTLAALDGQTGLANLCTMLQLPTSVVQDLERFLIRRGFIRLDAAGRAITSLGAAKLPNRNVGLSAAERRLERAS